MADPFPILFLDLGTHVGWAVDGATTVPPRAGVYTLVNGEVGRRGFEFIAWVHDFGKLNKIRRLVLEAPIRDRHRKETNIDSIELALSLVSWTKIAAYWIGVPWEEANVQTVRKHFVGSGFPKDPKRVVADRCRLLGWPTFDHNATDALAGWAYAKAKHDPHFRYEATTPLFGAAGAPT